MDYCELLYKAQENKMNASHKEVRCYTTSFGAPKKLERSKVSSENIKKFLARKEEEEKKKLLEAKKKKDELLALRSQDKKAQKRVQVMLKRTKSANKSVMADAIDNVNTADTLAGPMQCDEDDYGYVSQEASAYYNKLMDKYQNIPTDKPFLSKGKREVKDLNAAKDRVKAALLKEAEEELQPHKRKRKKKDGDDKSPEDGKEDDIIVMKNEKDEYAREDVIKQEVKFKKPKRPLPPPLDFSQLLKIAEKKQFEPIVIEKAEVEKEPERLMTKKEKMEYLKEKERRASKDSGGSKAQIETKRQTTIPEPVKDVQATSNRPLKDVKKKDSPETYTTANISNNAAKIKTKTQANENHMKTTPKSEKGKEKVAYEVLEDKLHKSAAVWSKPCNTPMRTESVLTPKKVLKFTDKEKDRSPVNTVKSSLNGLVEKKVKQTLFKENPERKGILQKKTDQSNKLLGQPEQEDELSEIDREIELLRKKRELLAKRELLSKRNNIKFPEPKEMVNESNLLITDNKPKSASPKIISESRNKEKLIKGPPQDLKKLKAKRRRINSESDYDSELEDFIDDGPEEETDYSKHIREIFGYDKSRYRDVEEDECMESNFAQQMKEEFVSTKLGILEDLEDIRKEQEEKARKKMKKQIVKTKR